MDSWQRTVELPCSSSSVSDAREFVATILVEQGYGDMVADARVVVSELSTNSVLHAKSAFRLTLVSDARDLLLSVSDESALLPAPRSPGSSIPSGRGLLIVDVLSGSWGVDVHALGGKTVWARLPLR